MLPSSGPIGEVVVEKFECQQQDVKKDLSVTNRKNYIKTKTGQKYNWDFTVNFVSFENDKDRQRSYELWIESFFHFVN